MSNLPYGKEKRVNVPLKAGLLPPPSGCLCGCPAKPLHWEAVKIGLVTTTYLPSRNGVATSTALFAQGLRAAGHEVDIYAPRHPAQTPTAPEEVGVQRLPSSMMGTPADYPLLLWPNRAVVAGLPLAGTDLFHTMHPFLPGALAKLWGRRFHAPVVFTAHTQYDQYVHYAPMPRRVSLGLVRAHVATFARSVDRVLVPGQAMAQMLKEYGYAGPVTRMPNPVDLRAFVAASTPHTRAEVRTRYDIAPQAPLVISLGRLAPEKNLGLLLDAFGLARQSRPELRLLVVGDGPARAGLEARHTQGAVFTGAVPYSEVPNLLAAADVFMTASESEVLPMSMIEALSSRTPLVAARSPAAEDLIDGQNGLISEAHAAALADALLTALHPDTLSARQEAAFLSAQQYDLKLRAADLMKVYEEVLAEKAK